MRVCILGPINNKDHFGGVATFNEGLIQGFYENNCEVLMITNMKSEEEYIKFYSKKDIILLNKKVVTLIKDFNPDIVISSMWYGILNKSIKRYLPNTKVIQFIHGFPTYRYKWYKRYLLNTALKQFRKYSDYFIGNSDFTCCINKEIYGINCDKTIHIGLKEKFVDFEKSKNEITSFIFVGRLVKEKNVDKICELFNYIYEIDSNIKLTIVGDGPEKENLQSIYSCENIKFLGKRTREETLMLLRKSDIFVSLNPHEPFGLVFLEAIINKCKIICPNTGGQIEFLNKFKEVLSIDVNDFQKHKNEILNLIKRDAYENEDLYTYFEYFNYERVARDIIKLK